MNEGGISLPEDIGLLGFDDTYLSKVLGLTTIYQLLAKNARPVMKILFGVIENETGTSAMKILLTSKLIV